MLVLTADLDPTADLVVDQLNRRGVPLWRVDPGDFPEELALDAEFGSSGWCGRLAAGGRGIDLSVLRAVYWRRPSAHRFPVALPVGTRRTCERQSRAGLRGVLLSLPDVTWVSDPRRIEESNDKARQLQAFRSAGLAVPPTLITNDPGRLAAFAVAHGGHVITKTLGPISHTENGLRHVTYTHRVPEDRWADPGIAAAAHLFQAEVPKLHELRVAVVGDRVFTTKIHAHSELARLGWRADPDGAEFRPGALPEDVRAAVLRVTAVFGLHFAAWDLIVRPDGAHVALELNPNGQWAFTPDAPQIAAALADLLQNGPRP